jgi:hypothetical protein
VVDREGELDERAGLAEEDVGIDAGERGLPELGDGLLLPVAGLDLGAEMGELREVVRTPAGNQVERLVLVRGGSMPLDLVGTEKPATSAGAGTGCRFVT